MTLAQRAGLDTPERRAAVQALLQRVQATPGLTQVRVAWADLHGSFRGKALVCGDGRTALTEALHDGVGLVSTLLLKDSSDRTAFPVFEPGGLAALPGFGAANNLLLLPDPASFTVLPWAPQIGWLRAEPLWEDGSPVALCPRRVLQHVLGLLREAGFGLRCGLEVELHVYRLDGEGADGLAVSALHPGHGLLREDLADRCDAVLALLRDTALGLGLPLRSLEVEIGPSQLELVFDATDALTAADQMLQLRNGVRQALRRAGWHATFMCKPPLDGAMASGWHLHQSLVDAQGANAFCRPAPGAVPTDQAGHWLSDTGVHWLAGLLAHAAGLAALCAPTPSAYGRYQGSPMAPRAAHWGRDNRGAMLRVVGGPGDAGTRIENRLGEPLANPYLCLAAQVLAGLDGLQRRLLPPAATVAPYAVTGGAAALPTHLGAALDALAADPVLRLGLGEPLVQLLDTVKRQELARRAAAPDPLQWDRQETFTRF